MKRVLHRAFSAKLAVYGLAVASQPNFKTMAKTKQQFNKEYYEKHKSKILANRKTHRIIHGQKQYCKDKQPFYWRRWYVRNCALYLGKKRLYSKTPEGIQGQLTRLYRFIERHPEISGRYLHKIERWIRINETIGLFNAFTMSKDRMSRKQTLLCQDKQGSV